MIKSNLLKFSIVWNLRNKIVCRIYSNIFWYRKIKLCDKNKRNDSVTIGLSLLFLDL